MKAKAVRILGAGPSGLSAAITLAKADYHVDVFERRSDAGKRFRGDLQALENWSTPVDILKELENINIRTNFDTIPFLKQTITNGTQRRVSTYDTPLGYLVKRGPMPGSLDQGLKQQALEAGVQIHFRQTLPVDQVDVVATGPISREIFAIAHGVIFNTHSANTTILLANDQAAFKGYAYLVIHQGYGCLCTVLFDDFPTVKICFENSKRMFAEMVDLDIQNPVPVGGMAGFSSRNIFQQKNQLYVGEAAGLQDLLWGFGLRSAFLSGHLAAQSIIHGQNYSKMAGDMFGNRLKASIVNRFIWEIIRLNKYQLVAHSKEGRPIYLSSLYSYDKFHRLLYPIARLFVKRRYPNLRV